MPSKEKGGPLTITIGLPKDIIIDTLFGGLLIIEGIFLPDSDEMAVR